MSLIIINEMQRKLKAREKEIFTIGSRLDLYKEAWDKGRQVGLESAQPKWISVEERLPSGANGMDFCVNVVVYTQDKQVTTGWFNGEIWYLLNWDNDFISKHSAGYVTHWMPLPNPPKEET